MPFRFVVHERKRDRRMAIVVMKTRYWSLFLKHELEGSNIQCYELSDIENWMRIAPLNRWICWWRRGQSTRNSISWEATSWNLNVNKQHMCDRTCSEILSQRMTKGDRQAQKFETSFNACASISKMSPDPVRADPIGEIVGNEKAIRINKSPICEHQSVKLWGRPPRYAWISPCIASFRPQLADWVNEAFSGNKFRSLQKTRIFENCSLGNWERLGCLNWATTWFCLKNALLKHLFPDLRSVVPTIEDKTERQSWLLEGVG
jgi:hypothetical protein